MSCGQTDVGWFVKVARDSSARGSGGIGNGESGDGLVAREVKAQGRE